MDLSNKKLKQFPSIPDDLDIYELDISNNKIKILPNNFIIETLVASSNKIRALPKENKIFIIKIYNNRIKKLIINGIEIVDGAYYNKIKDYSYYQGRGLYDNKYISFINKYVRDLWTS